MPARTKKIRHDENTRAKIQAAHIIRRFQQHVMGDIELSSTQISAGKVLLDKVLPNLTSVEATSEVTHNYVARMPEMSDTAETWQSQHAPTIQ